MDIIRDWWLISVSGYGEFGFFGTDAEAEEMRAHKARWERGVARKTRVCADHPLAVKAAELAKWKSEHGYSLDEREMLSINA